MLDPFLNASNIKEAASIDVPLMQASDFFIPDDGPSFTLWVKEQKLIMAAWGGDLMVPYGQPPNLPKSPFPFARFAAVNQTNFYLYHQINSSHFAEDVWDSEALNWVLSTNISISEWD